MKKYDEEFKKEAVKKYLDGQTVASISREIGVNENTIHKWKQQLLSVNGEVDQEKLAMRKRIFELEHECEILKKCMAPPPESTVERILLALGGTNAANVSGFFFVKALAFEP